jgi:ribosomal protein S27AE
MFRKTFPSKGEKMGFFSFLRKKCPNCGKPLKTRIDKSEPKEVSIHDYACCAPDWDRGGDPGEWKTYTEWKYTKLKFCESCGYSKVLSERREYE